MQKLTRDKSFQPRTIRRSSTGLSAEESLSTSAIAASTLGTNAALYFEDRLTMQYQVQEMLRIERIFEADGINEELEAYNPLIPDGSNWKATFMIEFPEVEERRAMLTQLRASRTGFMCRSPTSIASLRSPTRISIASDDEKTSAVHFLRFELPAGTGCSTERRRVAGRRHRSRELSCGDQPGCRQHSSVAARRSSTRRVRRDVHCRCLIKYGCTRYAFRLESRRAPFWQSDNWLSD